MIYSNINKTGAFCLPDQMVSDKEKGKYQFSKDTIDFYINEAMTINDSDMDKIKECINIINGELSAFDMEYILNPYKFEDGKVRQMPGRFKNFNIILPLLNLFLGEFISSQMPYTVYSTNSDVKIKKLDDLKNATAKYLTQEFTNFMNQAGFETGMPSEEQEPFKEFLERYENEWVDDRTLIGQESIDFLTEYLKLQNTYLKAFTHWLLTDRFITYKTVRYDTVIHELVHPLEAFPITNKNEYIEDQDGFVRMDKISLHELIDVYRDDLSQKDINKIITDIKDMSSSAITTPMMSVTDVNAAYIKSEVNRLQGLHSYHINRYHVVYKSPSKVGVLTYMNQLGEVKTADVSQDYKLDKERGDIKIEWEWINRVFEGYRFGDGDDGVYIPLRLHPIQRDDLNNKSICKLPYAGKIGMLADVKFSNPVSMGIEYQLRYNVWHRKLEMTINKHKDKIIVFPKGMIPTDDDITGMDDFLYFATADGFMFYDETSPNASYAVQGIKVLDMNLYDYIGKLYEVINAIKQEFWDSVGMNANRYGQIKASQGKGVNEDAIARSSTISINMFDSFYAAIENDLQGLLDVSKFAWIDEDESRSIGSYIASDNRVKHFAINGRKHLESNYGVFIGRYGKTMEKIRGMKELAFSMAQNGNHDIAVVALNSENPIKLEQAIKAAMEAEKKFQQQMEQQKQETQMQIEQMISEREAKKQEVEIYKAELQSQTDLSIAGLNADTAIENAKAKLDADMINNQNQNTNEQYNQDKIGLERAKASQSQIDKMMEIATKKQIEDAKNATRIYEKNIDLQIAKENKNKHDTPKKK